MHQISLGDMTESYKDQKNRNYYSSGRKFKGNNL